MDDQLSPFSPRVLSMKMQKQADHVQFREKLLSLECRARNTALHTVYLPENPFAGIGEREAPASYHGERGSRMSQRTFLEKMPDC